MAEQVGIPLDAMTTERDRLKTELRRVESEQRKLEVELKTLRQAELRAKREIEALTTLIELSELRAETSTDET